ncbi:translation initiation factor IF-2-like [Leopardus geoffroyi]|uniref:translation initiation factor IF-2-like n=1 Tax=Leopardus geoffroyi TaxID=46844 RepID=UPI001E261049|nr:translation initiation factor IF-2-like [Leopardus geoffroyi]
MAFRKAGKQRQLWFTTWKPTATRCQVRSPTDAKTRGDDASAPPPSWRRLRDSHPLPRRRDQSHPWQPPPSATRGRRNGPAGAGRPGSARLECGTRIRQVDPRLEAGAPRRLQPGAPALVPTPSPGGRARGPGAGRRREGGGGAAGRVPGTRCASERAHESPARPPRSPRSRSPPRAACAPDQPESPTGGVRGDHPRAGEGRAVCVAPLHPPAGSRHREASGRRPDRGAAPESRRGRGPREGGSRGRLQPQTIFSVSPDQVIQMRCNGDINYRLRLEK